MKIIIGVIAVAGVLLIGGGFGVYKTTTPQNASDESLYDVTIKDGDGLAEVAEKLEEQGVVTQPTLFRYAIILSGKASSIQTGNYELTPNASINDTIDILTGGDHSIEGSITIKEGLTDDQIADEFAQYYIEHSTDAIASEEQRLVFKGQFLDEMNNVEKYRSEYSFLSDVPDNGSLEGYLFPDTYRFFKDATPEDIIRKMLNNFNVRFSRDLRLEAKTQGKTVHEIITLASIVQREVAAEYMKDIAGIFYNRLAIGMKLQSDATVNYVTQKDTPQPSFADLEVDSRYNTYKFSGLPPGPVSAPGLAAIEATLYPSEHDYFFFLTKLDTGEPVFAKTGKGHLQNKREFLDK